MATVHWENGNAAAPQIARIDLVRDMPEESRPVASGSHHGANPNREHHLKRLLSAVSSIHLEDLGENELRLELGRLIEELETENGSPFDYHEQEALIREVVDECIGLGPIAQFMRESDVSEILVNGPRQVFVERRGQLQATEVVFQDQEHLLKVLQRTIASSGRRLDRKSPMVDTRLPDGSRMNAVLGPPALNGPLVSIRRFGVRPLTVDDLLANDSLTIEMLDFLSACVKAKINTIVSGGTGSGKTTLLNALSRFIPSSERLVTIEDTAELELQQPHVAKLEAQPADLDGEGQVTMRDLVRNALRMRPDRIIVGECRGGEAFEMLQAMSTGHEGSMTTIHATNAREALTRVELIVGLAGMDLPARSLRNLIASSINLVVQASRLPGGKRKIVSISEITGLEGDTISMHDLFSFVQTGISANLGTEGYFQATGIRPHLLNKLKTRGADLKPEMFFERRLQPQSSRGIAR
jgi:pilus assembly protein CpaF